MSDEKIPPTWPWPPHRPPDDAVIIADIFAFRADFDGFKNNITATLNSDRQLIIQAVHGLQTSVLNLQTAITNVVATESQLVGLVQQVLAVVQQTLTAVQALTKPSRIVLDVENATYQSQPVPTAPGP